MFLREKSRTKEGKTHRYWSVVGNRRVSGGGVVQRQVLYLGELNDNQRAGWVRTIEAFSDEKSKTKQMALFPDDREELPILACETVRVHHIERVWARDHGTKDVEVRVLSASSLNLDTFWNQ